MRRFPLQALVDVSGMSEAALARRVGLSGTTLKLARSNGLTEAAADRYACRAGFSMHEVWPDWLEALDVKCAAPDCPETFVPSLPHHRFCSETCRRREKMRRYRATERGAEVVRQIRRRYRADPKVRAHEARVKRSERARARDRQEAAA